MTVRGLAFWAALAALSLASGLELRQGVMNGEWVPSFSFYVAAFLLAGCRVIVTPSFLSAVVVPVVVILGFGLLGFSGGFP